MGVPSVMMEESAAILIAGPTASGKSQLAIALAERHGGVIINADAMQVYRDLAVLTARPTTADEAAAPHALYGHIDAATLSSVAVWLVEAAAAIAAARAEKQVPIIVGGTGLYLAALTEGLSAVPPVPGSVRSEWRARADGPAVLHAALARRDPVMAARLRPSDPQRVLRALEVIEATGRSLADWQEVREPPVLPLGPGIDAIVLAPERAALRERVAVRFEAMMERGAVAEAVALTARGLPGTLPAMRAIGVAPLADYAAGRTGRDEAVGRAVTESRQYAKRQDTWFRHRFATWRRAGSVEEALAG